MGGDKVVNIFSSKLAKCRMCDDVLRIPGFPLNTYGVCFMCSNSPGYKKWRKHDKASNRHP